MLIRSYIAFSNYNVIILDSDTLYFDNFQIKIWYSFKDLFIRLFKNYQKVFY